MKKLILAAILSATAGVGLAQAQTFPKEFLGEWIAHNDDEPVTCTPGAMDRMESDAIMKIEPRSTTQWESSCRLQGIKIQYGTGNVRLVCNGQGERWQVSELWAVRKIGDKPVLLTSTQKDGAIRVFQKCQ
jgi:hypothetical protein